jgi:hypothetical protein
MLKMIILVIIRNVLPPLIMCFGGILTFFLLNALEIPFPIALIASSIGGGVFFYVVRAIILKL